MIVSRPLPKSLLKKMFLKVLHEHKRPGGCYTNHGWYSDRIVRQTIDEYTTRPQTWLLGSDLSYRKLSKHIA